MTLVQQNAIPKNVNKEVKQSACYSNFFAKPTYDNLEGKHTKLPASLFPTTKSVLVANICSGRLGVSASNLPF